MNRCLSPALFTLMRCHPTSSSLFTHGMLYKEQERTASVCVPKPYLLSWLLRGSIPCMLATWRWVCRHVMNDVSEDSLVLVDELGKGTEPHAGAAIAATFVEFLDTKGCRGIFATCADLDCLPLTRADADQRRTARPGETMIGAHAATGAGICMNCWTWRAFSSTGSSTCAWRPGMLGRRSLANH